MIEDKEQTATENANEQAPPATEESGAQESPVDLETALSEYDERPGTTKPEPKPKTETDLRDDRLAAVELELSQRTYREDMGKVVNSVRGDFTAGEVRDKYIDNWVNAEAQEDPRIAEAWSLRQKDPARFHRVVKGLGQKFALEHANLSNRDEKATGDREAVAAAVQGASKQAPEGKAPNYAQMNDNEFREQVKKDHGFTPL